MLERSPPLLNILHHSEDDTKFGLGSGGDDDTGTAACVRSIVKYLPIEA
jgi:hypothetical protein